jgi:protein gp37
MGDRSAIEWTDATWNPVTGCSKVSPGCANCYAETLSLRFGWTSASWTPANAAENVKLRPERLLQPLAWRRPRMVFVNSMSDLFHELVEFEYVDRVFAVMAAAPKHTFQILTKRPERMRDYARRHVRQHGAPLPNVWLGVSIENNRWTGRADVLRETPAAVRFISAEPLLGPLTRLDLTGIDWIIVGGESGGPPARRLVQPSEPAIYLRDNGRFERGARQEPKPEALDWVRDIRDRSVELGVAFFLKQWGGRTPKAGGRLLDGKNWAELPIAATSPPTTHRRSSRRTVLGG